MMTSVQEMLGVRRNELLPDSLLFFAGAAAPFWWLSKGHPRLAYPLI